MLNITNINIDNIIVMLKVFKYLAIHGSIQSSLEYRRVTRYSKVSLTGSIRRTKVNNPKIATNK